MRLTVVARWLARSLVRDVDAICEVAESVAAGRLDARVAQRAQKSVETRLLAERLDQMIGRLGELVASQRNFISSAAHELRSPLTSLRGELELALRRERSAAEYKETIERALADAVTLVTLADDLLAIARSEHRNRTTPNEPARAAEILEEAARMARGNAESRMVEVVIEKEAEEAAVTCSRKEVARALRNLLDNAIAHSPRSRDSCIPHTCAPFEHRAPKRRRRRSRALQAETGPDQPSRRFDSAGRLAAATSAVSGPHAAVSPLQHSAWLTPNIGQPLRTQAA